MPRDVPYALKLEDLKYYQCPVSVITSYSWELLRLVNDTVNNDGDLLPLCPGHPAIDEIAQRPRAWQEAVRIVKSERAAHRQREMEKTRNGK